MSVLKERVAHVEGQMSEQSQFLVDIRADIRRLEDRMSRQFLWLVGLQFTTLVTIVSVILTRG